MADAIHENVEKIPTFSEARRQFEQDYLVRLMQLTRGNVAHAARLARLRPSI